MYSFDTYVVLGIILIIVVLCVNNIYSTSHALSRDLSDNTSKECFSEDVKYRRVFFDNTKFYFLTVNNEERKEHILDEFKEFSPIEVNPVTGISRNMSGATGFARMIDKGLRDQDINKPFQPFVMLEDDSTKYREFPEYIDIPEDADIVYLGLHGWGYTAEEPINIVYSEHVDDQIMRVKNLLALHAVLVCSPAGASVIQRSMVESFYRDKPWDIPITHAQPFYNVYALKTPLVYQDGKYGGKQSVTKIVARKHWFVKMPEKHINKTGTTNIMCWK